jgi:hypothetical protein
MQEQLTKVNDEDSFFWYYLVGKITKITRRNGARECGGDRLSDAIGIGRHFYF